MLRRAEELNRWMEEEGSRRIASLVPERPTEAEAAEHDAIHPPPQAWCPHCIRAMSTRAPHMRSHKKVPDVEVAMDRVPTISADVMYICVTQESTHLW